MCIYLIQQNNSPKNRSSHSPAEQNTNSNTLTVTSLTPGRPHSISSSNQTLNSVHSTLSAQTGQTVILHTPSSSSGGGGGIRLRRSSESDLQYYSANSSPSSHYFSHTYTFDSSNPPLSHPPHARRHVSVETTDAEVQTEEMLCPCCRVSLTYCNVSRPPSSSDDWIENNGLIHHNPPLQRTDSDDLYHIPRSYRESHNIVPSSREGKVNFYISTESEADFTTSASSSVSVPPKDLHYQPPKCNQVSYYCHQKKRPPMPVYDFD